MDGDALRILSIQSQVVRGFVGNNAAVFPLQVLGNYVDVINTVQYPSSYNHQGPNLSKESIKVLLDGVLECCGNNLLKIQNGETLKTDHEYLITGFFGDPEVLLQVVDFTKQLKSGKRFERPIWFCDPVLGDNNELYVVPELIEVYRREVLPLTDVLTPNHYELQWLTKENISSREDVLRCCRILHHDGPSVIIVTSVPCFGLETEKDDDMLELIGSEIITPMGGGTSSKLAPRYRCFRIPFRRRDVYLCGCGDLMTAMIASCFHKAKGSVMKACEEALAIVQSVVDFTIQTNQTAPDVDVVGGQHLLRHPTYRFQALSLE